ncbi:MAG: 23S rRNA (uracil(1939)-C(5))-methyltransferase RlmD [Candidatus Magasanikbacteria bacterium]|nr:23S rRNA (uracil(1939)-C(5))-methyltransferase RlmD [Candidatus Magasanikbacteria bacterium]NCS72182.1 23S rRNA (uracil(1939)-C(5))-methyltransferase RlmD [Candidatus Magasanikbacteria bacterium]
MRVTIETLVFGGQALARLEDGRVIFVWNALPGEVVDIVIIKKKKQYLEAVATTIITPSTHRITPTMPYYLSSAAWDMMDSVTENEWKTTIAKDVYKKIGDLSDLNLDIISSEIPYGYRNKIEFSFCDKNFIPKATRKEDHVEDISFAFFSRGSHDRIPVDGCALASPTINSVASRILAWVKEQGIENRSLKSLIVRSNANGEAIAALFIKDKLSFASHPQLDNQLTGFHIYYSSHKSPASRPDALLYSDGDMFLTETIRDVSLQYGLLSFFQVNPPLFEQTLADIVPFIDAASPVIDYYAGVGAIGLPLAKHCQSVLLVESNEEAVALATTNIALNNFGNASAHCIEAEKMTEVITSDHIVIVDPPRVGLHMDMVETLLAVRPKRIVYLSCNLSTQARDVSLLLEGYTVSFSRLYNYFPRTPHVEGLLVLERKH